MELVGILGLTGEAYWQVPNRGSKSDVVALGRGIESKNNRDRNLQKKNTLRRIRRRIDVPRFFKFI